METINRNFWQRVKVNIWMRTNQHKRGFWGLFGAIDGVEHVRARWCPSGPGDEYHNPWTTAKRIQIMGHSRLISQILVLIFIMQANAWSP